MPDPYINTSGLVTRTYAPKDRSIASMSGASQQLMPANPLRKAFVIQNDGANVLYVTWINAAAVADAAGTYELAVGASIALDNRYSDNIPKGAVFVMVQQGNLCTRTSSLAIRSLRNWSKWHAIR